jgi:hypothetical protein
MPPLLLTLAKRNEESVSALSGSASVLPGSVDGNWVHICTQSQSHPPLGSLMRLPGEFGGGRMSTRGDTWVLYASIERTASAIEFYVL